MTFAKLVGLFAVLACAAAQKGGFSEYDFNEYQQPRPKQYSPPAHTTPRPTPVPILKQINRHNEDGSYTYGFEGADGSFKIETKLANGEVTGKYGYVDDSGKVRTVEYGANKFGFQPSGEGITVPPPTYVDETTRKGPNGEILGYEDESYYGEAPVAPPRSSGPAPRSRPHYNEAAAPRPRPQYDDAYVAPVARPSPQSFPPAPPRSSYSGPSGPVPHRASVSGAAPSYSSAAPVPHRAIVAGAAPTSGSVFRSAPSSGPSYRPAPPPSYPAQSRPAPVREVYSAPRLLDDLEKQYSLPKGTPTHDISFGSYSSQTRF